MVKTISGNVEIGDTSIQMDLPVLSKTFCNRSLVSGDSEVTTGKRLIFLDKPNCIFSDRVSLRIRL